MGFGSDAFMLQPGETFTDGSISIDVLGPGQIRVRDAADVVVPPPPNPNIATLAALQPLVASLMPTITQQQKDTVATLTSQLVV